VPETTGSLVWRLSMKWRSTVDRAVAPLGLTHAQYVLLATLYGLSSTGARPSQRELADATGLEPVYVSRLARALESSGLIARVEATADSRAIELSLTPAGQKVVVPAIALVGQLHDELLAPLGGRRSSRSQRLHAMLEALLSSEPQGRMRIMTTVTQPVNGQDINVAAAATRKLLEVLLAEQGTSFGPMATLNTLASPRGASLDRDALVANLSGALGVDATSVSGILHGLQARGLVELTAPAGGEVRFRLTEAGIAEQQRLSQVVAGVTTELYSGFDPADLATTRQVLVALTERANTRLRTTLG
jgi:DNA-binding MarR family transcriptional regulator